MTKQIDAGAALAKDIEAVCKVFHELWTSDYDDACDAFDRIAKHLMKAAKALEPFAALEMPWQGPDHWPAFGKRAGEGWPTVGDFRHAREVFAALTATPQDPKAEATS